MRSLDYIDLLREIPDTDECVTAPGSLNSEGYGRVTVNGVRTRAHRASYEMHVAPIPPGLDIDHLCRNRACINPKHLEPVSRSENIRRGLVPVINQLRSMGQTHCKWGHELTPGSFTVYNGKRRCSECGRRRAREYYARRKARSK